MPTVSILIDEADSYLVAIRRGDGTWLKFTDRYVPAQDNAVGSIGLESSYTELARGFDRELLVFGTPTVTILYHVLRQFNPNLGLMNPNMKRQRKTLVQLAVLFCEAVRFSQMRARLQEIMEDGQSVQLPEHMWQWIQKWSTASSFALFSKRREDAGVMDDDPLELEAVESLGISSRSDLVEFLGLILHTAHVRRE
ncbi:hypothetical protein PVAP13_3NG031600 [Panicum virgatum]|uniref:rRNA N-glycosylase n=1 Tax=Panicum virgatum TaxID=38727 RepID=A0A8T0TSM4_PANVG|nr:hypothetical protein PVAP13_3NG031600 [Panicum virgatum]